MTYVRLTAVWLGVLLFRLLPAPFRVPNIEPLTASIMPVSRIGSVWLGALFASAGIIVYDALTAGIGIWTWWTAAVYISVVSMSRYFFATRPMSRTRLVGFGVIATLWYDALTGLTIGPLFWHQTFAEAFFGQIPFTLLHIASTCLFASTLAPVLATWLIATTEHKSASSSYARPQYRGVDS